jgi:hypothetical protein
LETCLIFNPPGYVRVIFGLKVFKLSKTWCPVLVVVLFALAFADANVWLKKYKEVDTNFTRMALARKERGKKLVKLVSNWL